MTQELVVGQHAWTSAASATCSHPAFQHRLTRAPTPPFVLQEEFVPDLLAALEFAPEEALVCVAAAAHKACGGPEGAERLPHLHPFLRDTRVTVWLHNHPGASLAFRRVNSTTTGEAPVVPSAHVLRSFSRGFSRAASSVREPEKYFVSPLCAPNRVPRQRQGHGARPPS